MSVRRSLAKLNLILLALATLAAAGCSSQVAETPAQQAAGNYEEMNFDLDKCLPIEPNLYRCPAIDQPLCTPDFARTDVICVHVGPKGHVYLQKTGMQ